MLPDHDHLSGRVNLDDAEPVMRELASPIPVGLRRMPDRKTRDQADRIVCQLRKCPQVPWLVPTRPQPWSLAGLTTDPGRELNFALAPYHPAEQARGTT